MIKLGDWNELKIKRFTEHGAQLDGGSVGKILMPARYVQRNMRPGQMVTVFVYLDQSDRLVATTETPLARVGDFAFLEVAWVNEHGAFLNWGLMKDLFVPFSEQKMRMEQGRSYLVHIHIDEETHRIVASAKVERYLQEPARKEYYRGRDVEVLLWHKTPLGFKVIVDNAYPGLIYDNQIYTELHSGERHIGQVITLREDGRMDVALGRIGKGRFRDFAEQLRDELATAPDGRLPFNDNSSAEEIAERFGVSKKTFKRAVGTLYRNREIMIEESGIALTAPKSETKTAE
ncbi:MAG: GntR family transcriptional regulator [Bacteroidaceae bacterium]|nr:GntR family transcriptional regulator [Bacteroidaceae bacterium]